MKRLIARIFSFVVLMSLVVGVKPVFAGIVSSLTDTVSSHTTSALANHTFKFVTPTGVESSSDTILLTFVTGFSLASLSAPGDFDFAVGSTGNCSTATFTDETLAASAAAGVWGVAVSGQAITFTAPTDAAPGEVTAGRCVMIEIGTNATAGVAGVNRIANPGTTGSKTIWISGDFGDSGETAVAITSPGQVTVGATVSGGASPGGGGSGPPPSSPPDTSAPVISNIRTPVIGPTNVEIAWDTNELANSSIDYGLTTSYEIGTVSDPSYVFLRQLAIGGLEQNTLYHFRVRSIDLAGNTAQSGDNTFSTIVGPDVTAPVISGINVTNLTATSATIGWTTNEPADAKVNYGQTASYGLMSAEPTQTTTHLIDLTGLDPQTTYHYQVVSKDAVGNERSSTDLTFTTLDNTAPIISGLGTSNLTETSATIVWNTDEDTVGLLQYGTAPGKYDQAVDKTSGFSHSAPLSGLSEDTTYYFLITAEDAAGNTSTTTGQFTTLGDTAPPAAVSNLVVTPGDGFNRLTWNNPSDSDFDQVYIFRKTSGPPNGPFDGTLIYQGTGSSFTNTGLTNGVRYYYGLFSRDVNGNFGAGAIADGMPTATQEIPVCGNNICDGSETSSMCPADCPLAPVCGNNSCEVGESNQTCSADCADIGVPQQDLNSFTASDIEITIRNRGVMIRPTPEGMFEVLAGTEILVAIPDRVLVREVESATLTIGNEQYRMFKGGSYDAIVQLPNSPSLLAANVLVEYTDGNWDQAAFSLNIVGQGLAYEMIEGQQTPVAGALVTLFSHANGKQFVQSVSTDANGNYAFIVQPGNYSVRAEKDGYGPTESSQAYAQSVVHQTLELIKIVPIEDIINSDAPLIDKVTAIIDQAGIQMQAFLDNENVQEQAEEVVAPAATALAVANAITIISVGAIANASAWFQYLFFQPILWFSRRKRKGWGTVYDSLTKLPIDLAVVRLADAATGRIIQSRVTDRQGRYFFIVDPGRYRLFVAKPSYAFPTEYLKTAKEDVKFTELYHAEDVVVTEAGSTLAANIPLDPIGKAMVPAKNVIFKSAMRKFQLVLSVVGVIAGAVAAYLNPTWITLGLLALQIVLFVAFRKVAKGKKPKGWGIVYDEKTKLPLANAVVRIFEPKYNKLLDTFVTDSRGRYAFIVGPSVYYTTYERAGYAPHRLNDLDYTRSGDSAVVDVSVPLATTGSAQVTPPITPPSSSLPPVPEPPMGS